MASTACEIASPTATFLGPQLYPRLRAFSFGPIDMLRALACFWLFTLPLALCAQPIDLSALDAEVETARRHWKPPGLAIVIVSPDRILLAKGYGVREAGRDARVDADTRFPIASCTKAFTAAALAMLVDDQAVAWDEPVRKHLPEFRLADPAADALVAVRDLLSHRTGLGSHDYLWHRAPWDDAEIIRRAGLLPLTGPFRASFAYQSVMYLAAGRIIARHHPAGWDAFVRDRLLTPLGMTHTTTIAPTVENRARGHRPAADRIAVEPMPPYPLDKPNAAGSIHTSARDLARWLQFHLGDGRWRGKRLVSTANLAETHKPQNIIPASPLTRLMNPDTVQLTYAMGWVVQDYRGEHVLAHAGLIDGFRCQFTLLPRRGLAIGIMNNLHGTRMNLPLTNRLIDLLLELPEKDWHAHFDAVVRAEDREQDETRKRRDQRRAARKPPTLALDAYAGTYEHPAYGIAVLRVVEGKLHWKWSSFDRELLPIAGDEFELRDVVIDEQEVRFEIQEKRVVKLHALGVEFIKK